MNPALLFATGPFGPERVDWRMRSGARILRLTRGRKAEPRSRGRYLLVLVIDLVKARTRR